MRVTPPSGMTMYLSQVDSSRYEFLLPAIRVTSRASVWPGR
jgi:hypothetical protein